MRVLYVFLMVLGVACQEQEGQRDTSSSVRTDTTDTSEENEQQEDTTMNMTDSSITFLALGDSYTIGESVAAEERWPVQLAARLQREGITIEPPQIIARTGWTTNELQDAIEDAEVDASYDIVSLLIGVNNQYRGYPIEQYSVEFDQLLLQAIELAGKDPSRVLVVSIPDYGVTPFAEGMDRQKIAREIDQYNQLAENIAGEYMVRFINITAISREATENPELIAEDGLHPSGEMYRRWVDLIFPSAKEILDK